MIVVYFDFYSQLPLHLRQIQFLIFFLIQQLYYHFPLLSPMLHLQSTPPNSTQMNPKSLHSRQIQNPTTILIQSRKPSNAHSLPNNIQNIKLSQVLPQKQIPQKKSLPIKEFEYTEVNSKIKRRTFSQFRSKSSSHLNTINQNIKLDRIPIKIIKDKIQFELNTKIQLKRGTTERNIRIDRDSEPDSNTNPESQSEQSQRNNLWRQTGQNFAKTMAREIYQEQVKAFNPNLSIFKRYHYENYENYNYKNPFKKNKYEEVIKDYQGSHRYEFPKNNKYQLHKGSSKNLEIVFCQTKYPDFVKKTNQLVEKQLLSPTKSVNNIEFDHENPSHILDTDSKCTEETSLRLLKKNIIEELGIRSRDLLNSKNTTRWAYSPQRIKSSLKATPQRQRAMVVQKNSNSKSTLQKHLQEFKMLQKLTLLNEKQQENNIIRKKQSPQNPQDFSKTAFVSLLIYKFSFLENLSRSFRNHLLKILFELDSISDSVKISIQEYLKFNRIFITKDSSQDQISHFIFQLLFKTSPKATFEAGKKVLGQLNPRNKNKLQFAITRLFEICSENDQRAQEVLEKIRLNIDWAYSIIQVIKDE